VSVDLTLATGPHQKAVAGLLAAWADSGFVRRLWEHDPTLWRPAGTPEITNRLGWLTLPEVMEEEIASLRGFGDELAAEGTRHAVVLGMGGSSLAPEVYQATFGNAPGHPELLVLDSTHPGAVHAVADAIDPRHTVFIVASKSGGTLETLSYFRYFWARTSEMVDTPGHHFVAVTDPGTPLEDLARQRGFRHTFQATPDVGGRYSALTMFGLVPAAAIGVDLSTLLSRARDVAAACGPDSEPSINPGLRLGATLGELALGGRDKVTFLAAPELAAFPSWIEQLIAESTGKEGKGIVPIVGEAVRELAAYGDDRVFIELAIGIPRPGPATALAAAGHPVARITLGDTSDLGAAMFLLEVAVAAAGSVIDIQPFNQPDVQVAKDLAKQAMAGELDTSGITEIDAFEPDLAPAIRQWAAGITAGDYVAVQAFLAPTASTRATLTEVREMLGTAHGVATTLDFGPRFLHSTGQLHKGGPNEGVFLEVVDEPAPHLDVPETDFDFGTLVTAQARGDSQALRDRGRRVLMVTVGDRLDEGLAAILAAVAETAS
jgi:transaldolase/glucose-6-phosphate isomerase